MVGAETAEKEDTGGKPALQKLSSGSSGSYGASGSLIRGEPPGTMMVFGTVVPGYMMTLGGSGFPGRYAVSGTARGALGMKPAGSTIGDGKLWPEFTTTGGTANQSGPGGVKDGGTVTAEAIGAPAG